jgi:hypothetical protein
LFLTAVIYLQRTRIAAMGMFLKTIVAFCLGAGMLIGAQHLWMSSITEQIRLVTARQALPQTQLKPAFSVDGDKLPRAIMPTMAPIDSSISQRLGVEGAARRVDIQVRNAQSAVPLPVRIPGMR